MVAGRTFGDLLTRDREAFHTEALQRLRERCAAYGPHGLGVDLEGLSLADLHPPQEVVESYHEVTTAMEKRDELINQAQRDALSNERAAGGEKSGNHRARRRPRSWTRCGAPRRCATR